MHPIAQTKSTLQVHKEKVVKCFKMRKSSRFFYSKPKVFHNSFAKRHFIIHLQLSITSAKSSFIQVSLILYYTYK